jgi:hypothetical protein
MTESMATTRRIVANPTFSQWSFNQRERPGTVGEVSRWIHNDLHADGAACWPHRTRTIDHMLSHLRKAHGKDKNAPLESDFRTAYSEVLASVRKGDAAVPQRQGGFPTRPPEDRKQHRGYLLKPQTITQIRELARHFNVSQGEILERIVNKEYVRAI